MRALRIGRAALVALGAAVACAAAASGPAVAADWLPGPVYGDGSIAGYADLAVSPDGGTTVAWTMPPSGPDAGATGYAQRTPAGAAPAPVVAVSPPGVASIVARVAAGRGGETLVLSLDYRAAQIRLTTLAADGAIAATRIVAGSLRSPRDQGIALAADRDGDALVSWIAEDADGAARLSARWIGADGTLGTLMNLADADHDTATQAAFARDGSARIAWAEPAAGGASVRAVRVTADGQRDTSVQTLSSADVEAAAPTLAASAAGVVVSWIENRGVDGASLHSAPLPGSGPVAGPARQLAADLVAVSWRAASTVQLGDDGALTAVWSGYEDDSRSAVTLWTRTISAAGEPGPVAALSGPTPAGRLDQGPRLVRGVGGERYALWARRAPGGSFHDELLGRSIAADGTLGPVATVTSTLVPATIPAYTAGADALGNLAVGWIDRRGTEEASLYDWATATLQRAVPVTPIAPDTPIAPGPDPAQAPPQQQVTTPAPAPPVGGTAPGRATAKRPAALRITAVRRTGARVTVSGRIDRRARGRVTIVWRQQAGRRTVTRSVRARIARGRFAATLRLPAALATARGRARVTVTYAGDATTRAGKIGRVVLRPLSDRNAP